MSRASVLALSLVSVAGCDASDAGPVDGRDDAFLVTGKADGAISEDSTEARAVLDLVNTASFAVLDDSDEVGLDVRAADGIYNGRVGADGVADTDDDLPFETLAQLDAVPWVGPSAFRKLQEYALANGYGSSSCDDGLTMLDRCYVAQDEDVSEVPTSESIHHYPFEWMQMHHAGNGFTVTGKQDLYESPSWVTRGAWAEETAEGWHYATGGVQSYVVDAMLAPDGLLDRVSVGRWGGHSRVFLSAGDIFCDARDIGQVMDGFAAYGPDGHAVAAALISEGAGRHSIQICQDSEWETVEPTNGSTKVGIRFTANGEPQVIEVLGSQLRVLERDLQGGWERVVEHHVEQGTHVDDIDVVEAPGGGTYVYIGTQTYTDDSSVGDLSVERVHLDDAGARNSVVLFDGRGDDIADARGAHLVQAGVDTSGREFVAIDRLGAGSAHLIDVVAYDAGVGVERLTVDSFTTMPGHGLNAGFAVAPDGTLGLSLQSLGSPLRVRWMNSSR